LTSALFVASGGGWSNVPAIEMLVEVFTNGLAKMFDEAKSNANLARRIREREAKVLQTMSDEDGRALFGWGERLLSVAEAPRVEFSDAVSGNDCELNADCSSPATVLIRGVNGEGQALGHVHGCKSHSEQFRFLNVIDLRTSR
jgi:hypothetical protein